MLKKFTNIGNKSLLEILELIRSDQYKNASSFDFSWNDLNKLSGDDLTQIIQAIPPSVVSLNLRGNNLDQLSLDALYKIFSALPKTVCFLNLDANFFLLILDEGLKHLNQKISSIDVNWSGHNKSLIDKSIELLITIIKSLHPNLTSLSLSANALDCLSPDNLIKLIQALPKGLIHLDLSMNFNGLLSIDDLCRAFKNLPKTLICINLEKNNLSGPSLNKLLLSLPLNVLSVRVNDEDINLQSLRIYAKINDEIKRLSASKSTSGNILVHLGLAKKTDDLITALESLKQILQNSSDTNNKEFQQKILIWRKKNVLLIDTPQNTCVNFFSTDKKSITAKMIDEVFMFLEFDEDVSKELVI